MLGSAFWICLMALAAAASAQDSGDLQPPLANQPVVDEALLGTWRLYDIETQSFEPTGTGIVEISADSFSMFGNRILPNSDSGTWIYMSDGLLGENTDMFYLPFCYYTYEEAGDYLIIADTPEPTLDTPGAAVFRRTTPQ